jgi:hypothetical protein
MFAHVICHRAIRGRKKNVAGIVMLEDCAMLCAIAYHAHLA